MNKTAWNKETVDGEKRKKKNKEKGAVSQKAAFYTAYTGWKG